MFSVDPRLQLYSQKFHMGNLYLVIGYRAWGTIIGEIYSIPLQFLHRASDEAVKIAQDGDAWRGI